MGILKVSATVIDILLALIIVWFSKGQRDKCSRIGFGTMFAAYIFSVFLIWI